MRKIKHFARLDLQPSSSIISAIIGISVGFYLLIIFSFPQHLMILFVIGAICAFVFMIGRNLQRPLLAIIIFDTALQLDVNIFHNDELAAIGALGGLNISVTTIALAVLYIIWLSKIFLKTKPAPAYIFKSGAPLIAYFGFACLSVFVAKNRMLSFFEISMLFQMLLLFFYIIGTVRTREDVIFILLILILSLTLESVIMIGLKLSGRSFDFFVVTARVQDGERVAGTLGSANVASSFLELLLAPMLAITMADLKRPYKILGTVAFFCGCVALILTLSRGGWIGAAVSLSFFTFFAWRQGWLSPSVTISIIIVLALLTLLYHDTFLMRLLRDDQGAAYSRIPLMKLAVKMTLDHYLLGVGANNFATLIGEYARQGFHDVWLYTVHNKYLLVLAETGIGGLVAFLWFLIATLRRGWLCYRIQDPFLSPVSVGFSAAILGNMIHMNVDLFNSRPTVQLLWLVAGLITAIYSILREEEVNGQLLSLKPQKKNPIIPLQITECHRF